MLERRNKLTLKGYVAGWYAMWKWAPSLLRGWGIKPPRTYDRRNIFGGVLWGTPAEYRNNHPLSGQRCARVLERAFEKKVPLGQLLQMRKTCSLIYMLHSGEGGKNFPVVDSMVRCLGPDERNCGPKVRSLVPTKIMSPDQLKESLTKEWRGADSGMSLVDFLEGATANYHWNVLGARSGVDLDKIKCSETHYFDEQKRFFTTAYVDGRSKLPLHKNGTRPWNAWHLCMCPGAVHVSPPEGFEYTFDAAGNPHELPANVCTTCPVFAGEVISRLQEASGTFRHYKKWTLKRFQKQNHGNIVALARRWLVYQGVMTAEDPFCSNSGRKCLAGWTNHVGAGYAQSVHISGDTEDVWRENYALNLEPCGYKVRQQSTDYLIATAALRKLRKFLGREAPPEPLPPGMTRGERHMQMISECFGIGQETRQLYVS